MVDSLLGLLLAALFTAVAEPGLRGPVVVTDWSVQGERRANAQAAQTVDIVLVVTNVRNDRGRIRFALWDRPGGFTKSAHAAAEGSARATVGATRLLVPGLPAGRYAAAVYHDENDNGEFDRTWIGWPAEGLAFSNGAWIGLGPPDFEAAAVAVTARSRTIELTLRY